MWNVLSHTTNYEFLKIGFIIIFTLAFVLQGLMIIKHIYNTTLKKINQPSQVNIAHKMVKKMLELNILSQEQVFDFMQMNQEQQSQFVQEQMRLMNEQQQLLFTQQMDNEMMHMMNTGIEFGGMNPDLNLNPSMNQMMEQMNHFNDFGGSGGMGMF